MYLAFIKFKMKIVFSIAALLFLVALSMTSCSGIKKTKGTVTDSGALGQGEFVQDLSSEGLAKELGFENDISPPQDKFDKKPFVIGLLIPLEGSAKSIGVDVADAVKLSLSDNKAENVEVLAFDSGKGAADIEFALEKLNREHVDAVIGPVFSEQSNVVQLYLENKEVPVFSLSNDSSLLGRDNLYLFGALPEKQAEQLVGRWHSDISKSCEEFYHHAFVNLEKKNKLCGSLYTAVPSNKYGRALSRVVEKSSETNNYISSKVFKYDEKDSVEDIGIMVRRLLLDIKNSQACVIKKDDPDGGSIRHVGVLLVEGGWRLRKIYNQIRASEIVKDCDIQFLSLGNWSDEDMRNMKSVLSIEDSGDEQKRFGRRFMSKFRHAPSKISFSAYDAATAILGNMEFSYSMHKWVVSKPKIGTTFLGAVNEFSIGEHGESVRIPRIVRRNF